MTGRSVDPSAIAFIYTLHPFEGEDDDIRISPTDPRFISWPAPIGHEQITDREPVLLALFGQDFTQITKDAAYEQPIYETDDLGNVKSELIVVGKKIAYDSVELRRLAVKENLFGRFGRVRAVACLMLWNRCENWEEKADKLLTLLDVPDVGVISMANVDQWWVRDYQIARKE